MNGQYQDSISSAVAENVDFKIALWDSKIELTTVLQPACNQVSRPCLSRTTVLHPKVCRNRAPLPFLDPELHPFRNHSNFAIRCSGRRKGPDGFCCRPRLKGSMQASLKNRRSTWVPCLQTLNVHSPALQKTSCCVSDGSGC